MTTDIPIHEQKRQAIEDALERVLAAQTMDERGSMVEMTLDEATEYWDRLALSTKDGQVGFAAIEAECYIRRSERIANEPSKRGRRTDLELVSKVVTGSPAARVERSKMRVVGKNAVAAREHVKTKVQANRRVTRNSILRHIKKLAVLTKPKPVTVKAPAWETHDAQERTRILAAIDTLADGQRRTDRDLLQAIGLKAVQFVGRRTRQFLGQVRMAPWLTIDRTSQGTVFMINQALRDLCAGLGARPDLPGGSVLEFYKHIRAEITRRRKEANDTYQAANWRHGVVHTRFQSELLDWIETELDRVP